MQNEYEIKKEMCEIGKRVYNRGMVAANDGNFSVRISENEVLCTPTGVSKGFMTPDYICKVDLDGNVLQANKGFRPSSETANHAGSSYRSWMCSDRKIRYTFYSRDSGCSI